MHDDSFLLGDVVTTLDGRLYHISKLSVGEAVSLKQAQATDVAVGHAPQNDFSNESIEATVASPTHVSVLELLKGRLCANHMLQDKTDRLVIHMIERPHSDPHPHIPM